MTVEHVEALVVGAGMAGLTTAYRLAQRGVRPVVLEADTRVGGTVRGGTVGDHTLDLGAESFALRRPEARALAEELGLAVQEPAGGGSSVWTPAGPDGTPRALRIPADSILGIPAHPDAADVLAVIGPDGVARAERDAHLGPSAGADATDLASLVRVRMGQAVLDRLVRPVAGGIHAADPATLAVDSVTPGLREAMAERGSLAGAVAALRERAPAGAVVATTVGGLFRLAHALREVVDAQGEVRTDRRVTGLRPAPTGGWEVQDASGRVLRSPVVVLALPGPAALTLLTGLVDTPLPTLPAGSPIAHVTLVLDAPALDAAPRGAGLLVAPGAAEVSAKALTHVTAKWPWLAARTPPGGHVLRVSYGRPGDDPGLLDRVGREGALRDAEVLLDVPLDPAQVRASRVVRWDGGLPPAGPGLRRDVSAVQQDAERRAGLVVTGAWVAGTGVAAVVADAERAARSAAQWT